MENLEYIYNPGTSLEVRALEDVTFTLPHSKVLGIIGGTGSGKTTLVKNLNGLLTPTRGKIFIDGKDYRSYGPSLRRKVGVVFQQPERQLFEETVYKDISFALTRLPRMGSAVVRDRVEHACKLIGLDLGSISDHAPLTLSDGQKRKVAIAGILVNQPEALVLDEPAVGLDPPSLAELILFLQNLKVSGDQTIVVVSHDMDPFLEILDIMLVLDRGRVAAFDSPEQVCDVLGDDEVLREFLPELALLAHDLRKAGHPIPPNQFRITNLLGGLAKLSRNPEGCH